MFFHLQGHRSWLNGDIYQFIIHRRFLAEASAVTRQPVVTLQYATTPPKSVSLVNSLNMPLAKRPQYVKPSSGLTAVPTDIEGALPPAFLRSHAIWNIPIVLERSLRQGQ